SSRVGALPRTWSCSSRTASPPGTSRSRPRRSSAHTNAVSGPTSNRAERVERSSLCDHRLRSGGWLVALPSPSGGSSHTCSALAARETFELAARLFDGVVAERVHDLRAVEQTSLLVDAQTILHVAVLEDLR